MTSQSISIVESLRDVPAEQWDQLSEGDPFLSHAFLYGLETTACTGQDAGWVPCHILLIEEKRLVGAMPLYIKSHSYGEYVFDWAWADAYHRHGLSYYPKLVNAVPFTPVTGPRLLARSSEHKQVLARAAIDLARQTGMSSLHCLFPKNDELGIWEDCDTLTRRTVQFHWQNDSYEDFADFLSRMNHNKRKKIRQERRKLRDAGVACERIPASAASESDWLFFSKCYHRTYREHLSTPYLNLDFFKLVGKSIAGNLLLIFARRDGNRIAAALNVIGNDAMFGRYWGAIDYQPGLHFEVCYYQAIEHCIANGIGRFEGGAQGEHKLARGLVPVETVSVHWLARPEFAQAIEDYLRRETSGISGYVDELNERSPFKQSGSREPGHQIDK